MSSKHWAAFAALAFMWGTIYLAIKKALPGYSVVELIGWRYFVVGMVMTPIAWGYRHEVLKAKLVPWLALIGVLGSFTPVMFTTIAQRTEPSGLAGMFAALTPVTTALVAWLALKEKQTQLATIGLGLGFAGALLMIVGAGSDWHSMLTGVSWGALWFVAANFCWAIVALLIRQRLTQLPTLAVVSWPMMCLMPISLVAVFLETGVVNPSKLVLSDYSIWFWSTVALQMASLTCYSWLILRAGPVRATSVTYVVPFVAIAWGLWDGERITVVHFAGLVFVLLGLWLINKKK